MGRYTIRRLIGLIPTLLAVYTITFLADSHHAGWSLGQR